MKTWLLKKGECFLYMDNTDNYCWLANKINEDLFPICKAYILFREDLFIFLSEKEGVDINFTEQWFDKFYNITWDVTSFKDVFINFKILNKSLPVVFHNFVKCNESVLFLLNNLYESIGKWYDRKYQQCNHCIYNDWEYGTSVKSGWYQCKLGFNVNMKTECNHFAHFNGKLIRKQWLD